MPNAHNFQPKIRAFLARTGIFLINAGAVVCAIIFLALGSSINTIADSCEDVVFVFARGSGQTLDDTDFEAFTNALINDLTEVASGLNYKFYELGSKPQNGYQYPAVDLSISTALSAKISAGYAGTLNNSVNTGVNELIAYTQAAASSCPDTKFVIAGYSQGAIVISRALKYLNADQIAYAATFGDPKLYLPEGKATSGSRADACYGLNLSDYRAYVPNCSTYIGILLGQNPYRPTAFEDKIGVWCEDQDFMCGAGVKLSNLLGAHTSYASSGQYANASAKIINRLAKLFPKQLSTIDESSSPVASSSLLARHDIVLLIDRTGSMNKALNNYKTYALKLAQKIINAGGRVALYSYGDISEGQETIKLTDFGCSLAQFSLALNDLSVEIDSGGDVPESVLSAVKTVLTHQYFRTGATKSIIILTDANFHSPDTDGTTYEEVVNLALSIDPVNIYAIVGDSALLNAYSGITADTGGKASKYATKIHELVTSRPFAAMDLTNYSGTVNHTFSFSATVESTSEIITYEWDLDFDGEFETATSDAVATATYPAATAGYVQLKVTNANGYSSTASAYVAVTETDASLPATLKNLNFQYFDGSMTINFALGPATDGVMISADDIVLGYTTETSLTITDLIDVQTVRLIAVGNDGTYGDSYELAANAAATNPDERNINTSYTKTSNSTDSNNATPTIAGDTITLGLLAPDCGITPKL